MSNTSISSHEARESLIKRGVPCNMPGSRTAGFLIGEVAAGYGLETTQDDYDHWVVGHRLLRGIDHLVDRERLPDVTPLVEQLIDGQEVAPYISAAEAEVFARLMHEKYTAQRAIVQKNILCNSPVYQVAKSEADTFEMYRLALLDEIAGYAKLMRCIEAPDGSDAVEKRRINRWIERMLCIGYAIDSARDLDNDHKQGLTMVEPTIMNRLRMLGLASDIRKTASAVPLRSAPKVVQLAMRYGVRG